jgi:hypothetical protein
MLKAIPLAVGAAAAILLTTFFLVRPGADDARALTNCASSTLANDGVELQMLGLFNLERAAHGYGPLTLSQGLNNAAAWIVEDMNANGYFNHQPDSLGRSFPTRMGQCEVHGSSGEVLVFGTESPQAAFDLWMGSQGHREQILSPGHFYVGIAKHGYYWSAVLSSDASNVVVPTATTPPSTPTTPASTPTATPSPTPMPTKPASATKQGVAPFIVRE